MKLNIKSNSNTILYDFLSCEVSSKTDLDQQHKRNFHKIKSAFKKGSWHAISNLIFNNMIMMTVSFSFFNS